MTFVQKNLRKQREKEKKEEREYTYNSEYPCRYDFDCHGNLLEGGIALYLEDKF